VAAVAEGTLRIAETRTPWNAQGGVTLELALPGALLGVVIGSPRIQDELGHAAARAVAAAGPESYLGLTFAYRRPARVAAYRGPGPEAAVDPEVALAEARAFLESSPRDAGVAPAGAVRLENNVLCMDRVPLALARWIRRIGEACGVACR
jgi:hypothetical protein